MKCSPFHAVKQKKGRVERVDGPATRNRRALRLPARPAQQESKPNSGHKKTACKCSGGMSALCVPGRQTRTAVFFGCIGTVPRRLVICQAVWLRPAIISLKSRPTPVGSMDTTSHGGAYRGRRAASSRRALLLFPCIAVNLRHKESRPMKPEPIGPVVTTPYDCQRSGKTEEVDIQLHGIPKPQGDIIPIDIIVGCTGLETCGVKTTYHHTGGGSGSAFDWGLCPRNTILKNG